MYGILLFLSPLSAGIDLRVWKKSIWILLFDFVMLYVAATLCGFLTALIATLTLMNFFGPSVALPALGAALQNTFAAGNRVLDLLEEQPVAEDVHGYTPVAEPGDSLSGGERQRLGLVRAFYTRHRCWMSPPAILTV